LTWLIKLILERLVIGVGKFFGARRLTDPDFLTAGKSNVVTDVTVAIGVRD